MHSRFVADVEFRVIDVENEASMELLREAYHGIFVPAFPNEDDRESLEQLETYLAVPDGQSKVLAIVAGKNLDDADRRDIMGIATCCYYQDSATGSLAYNAIAPQYRNRGLGQALVQERIAALQQAATADGTKLRGVFIDIHNPALTPAEEDSMNPVLRQKIFEKWGARKIPFDTVWPAVEEGKPRLHNFITLGYAIDGVWPDAGTTLDYYRSIFTAFDVKDIDNDADFLKMKHQLDNWGSFEKQAVAAVQPSMRSSRFAPT